MSNEKQLRIELVTYGKLLYERGLAHGSAGNLSVRLDDGTILVTPTNTCLGRLNADALSKVAIDGAHLDGAPPSKEVFFHLAVYAERPSANAIVHLHSTYCVALSCLRHDNCENVLPPLTAYYAMRVGKLPQIGYFRPGDRALASAVSSAARDNHAMLLANHGPIVAGKTLEEAVYAYEELEETAKLHFILGGRDVAPLSDLAVAEIGKMFRS